jgi:hypothetical protein
MGVPQGTTLGHFSWNSYYSNDFPLYVVVAILIIFTVKGKNCTEVNEIAVETNNAVINFGKQSYLRLNAAKTNI